MDFSGSVFLVNSVVHTKSCSCEIFVCRIETYNQSTKPIVDHYDKLDKVRNVVADGSPQQVCVITAALLAYLLLLLMIY